MNATPRARASSAAASASDRHPVAERGAASRRRGGRAAGRERGRLARTRPSRAPTAALLAIFALGLLLRLAIVGRPHLEGDEVVYRALVGQLRDGHGYTLAGTPLIGPDYPASQYGRPLFFHPPGGIVLFLLLYRLFGIVGLDVAQVLSYAGFFAGVLWMFLRLAPESPRPVTIAVAALAALTPLLSHVTMHYWLDGPLLAISTLAAALLLESLHRDSLRLAAGAGLVLGAASWVKTTAFLVVPGLVLLAVALHGRLRRRLAFGLFVFLLAAIAIQLPWELWQWAVVGSPFPVWAGRPAPELVANNAYVRMLTVDRSPWIYASWLPRVLWTLVPALAAALLLPLDARARRIAWALAAWIVCVIGAQVALGAIGYSKVLRYAILVTPASVALWGVAAAGAWRAWSQAREPQARVATAGVLLVLGAGLVLELAQGWVVTFDRRDLIVPLFMKTS